MPHRNFKPNALLRIKEGGVVQFILLHPAISKTNFTVPLSGLSWNTTANKMENIHLNLLVDHLLEKLPIGRKFIGGVFQARVRFSMRTIKITVGKYVEQEPETDNHCNHPQKEEEVLR